MKRVFMEGKAAQAVFLYPQACKLHIMHNQLFLFEEVKLSAAFYAGPVRANVISTAVKEMKIDV